jgi:hypothetical protein
MATAGSCFAQNLGKYLKANARLQLLLTEDVGDEQPLFSALYGNIYTVRQLVQLFDQAIAKFEPKDFVWKRPDGRYVDGLRPYIFANGFANSDEVRRARFKHLQSVRRTFSECSVFVFTLGLTEGWVSKLDGTVFPIAPGVVSGGTAQDDCEFVNFTYKDVSADLDRFVGQMRAINPHARIILTVSPVPLVATFTQEHVLVATVHSKATLRAAAGDAEARFPNVFYFPAYEIITGAFSKGSYYEANLRSVTPEGVAHVMRVFEANYVAKARDELSADPKPKSVSALFDERDVDVVCDEEQIVKTVGF